MSFSKLAIAIEILNLARLFLFPLCFFKSSKLASSCLLNSAAKREDNSPGNFFSADISKPESSAYTIKLVKEAMPCAFKMAFSM